MSETYHAMETKHYPNRWHMAGALASLALVLTASADASHMDRDETVIVPVHAPENPEFDNCVWQIENISNKIAQTANLDPAAACSMYLDTK